jgi:hypothetical protein
MSISVFDPRTGKMVTIGAQEKPRAGSAPEKRDERSLRTPAAEGVRLRPKDR